MAQAQEKAKAFVKELYSHVKVLDSGARGSTLTFVQICRGDVLLAWENEALYSINNDEKGGVRDRCADGEHFGRAARGRRGQVGR